MIAALGKTLRVGLIIAAIVVAFLLLIRFVGSPIATYFTNRHLARMPQFSGHVGAVQLALWRGAISVSNLQLVDRARPEDGPAVSVENGALSLSLRPLIRGRLGGDLSADHVKVLMVKRAETSKDEKEQVKRLSKPLVRGWENLLKTEFPLEFRQIKIEKSELRFDDRTEPQVVSLIIDQIDLTASEFSNKKSAGNLLPAKIEMTARMGKTGRMSVAARADPAEHEPRFEVTFELRGLSLPENHDFFARYALIDAQSGLFDLYTEVKAANGSYDGYTKPFFKDLKFKAVPDPDKSLMQRAATKVAATFEHALKNDQGDVATKAPFHGDFADNKVDVWVTIENLLRNAFIQSLHEGLEGKTTSKENG